MEARETATEAARPMTYDEALAEARWPQTKAKLTAGRRACEAFARYQEEVARSHALRDETKEVHAEEEFWFREWDYCKARLGAGHPKTQEAYRQWREWWGWWTWIFDHYEAPQWKREEARLNEYLRAAEEARELGFLS